MKLQIQNAITGSTLLAALLLLVLVSTSGCGHIVNKSGAVNQKGLGAKTAELAASTSSYDPADGWTAAE